MNYRLYQLKLDQLVSNFKDNVIDLAPAFQRGRVWKPKLRRGLLKNILRGQPIPAIFLYKKPLGARNQYVILDGKQRLESILLFIGDQRADLQVPAWKSYFSKKEDFEQVHFKAEIGAHYKKLKDLTNDEIRKFREYLLSVIEIDLDEKASLEDVIQLFVDINSYGEKVKRFSIVKALYLTDPLLKQVFKLIGEERIRPRDRIYKIHNSVFARVLNKLEIVNRVSDPMNRVDIMWEKLFELALFSVTLDHRKPADILKEFISRGRTEPAKSKLTTKQVALLTRVFQFMEGIYSNPKIASSRWATDQTHFYILATTLISDARTTPVLPPETAKKLISFNTLLDGKLDMRKHGNLLGTVLNNVQEYKELSEKQTTDVSKRQERVKLFREIMQAL